MTPSRGSLGGAEREVLSDHTGEEEERVESKMWALGLAESANMKAGPREERGVSAGAEELDEREESRRWLSGDGGSTTRSGRRRISSSVGDSWLSFAAAACIVTVFY